MHISGRTIFRLAILWLLSWLALPPVIALAQGNPTDVFIRQIGPRRTIVRNVPWNNGSGNAGNNYIMVPVEAWETISVYIFNSGPVGATDLSGQINVAQTGDASAQTFLNCPTTGPQACSWTYVGTPQTINAIIPTATSIFTFTIQGAAVISINVLATGGANTSNASIFVVEAQQTASGGGSAIQGTFTLANQAAGTTVTPTTIFTPTSTGMYLVTIYLTEVPAYPAAAPSGSVEVLLSYTDGLNPTYGFVGVGGNGGWCASAASSTINPAENVCAFNSVYELELEAGQPVQIETDDSTSGGDPTFYTMFVQVSKA